MIKVLIADDHSVVRRGLRQILAETPDILVGGEASTVQEVRQLVQDQRWDVIVLDLNMPWGSGIELLSELRRLSQGPRVLVLTVYPEEQYAVRAIRAGAAGFLTKESAPERLIDAVRKIAAGGRYVSAELGEGCRTSASRIASSRSSRCWPRAGRSRKPRKGSSSA
jgi:two-component system, NarL family, invasion response regulator UvrY